MNLIDRLLGSRSSVVAGVLALVLAGSPDEVKADSCVLQSTHGGITFRVQDLGGDWTCRLKAVIDHYTTANTVGPLNTAMDESMYRHLLDRPPLAAALINRLDLAEYKAEPRGAGRWWASDGEGAEGIVQLVFQDRETRVYYLEGTHRSRLLPKLSGKAVVFLRMRPVKNSTESEAMQSTMVAYTMLENRVLSGLASLIRPLVGATVARKLAKGVDVVNRLGLEMRQRPERVLFEATDPPSLPEEDVAFLKQALAVRTLSPVNRSGQSAP